MLKERVNFTVYAQEGASTAQLNLLTCAFYICLFHHHTDNCSVNYTLLESNPPSILIWNTSGPSPSVSTIDGIAQVRSDMDYRPFYNSLQGAAFENTTEVDADMYDTGEIVIYGFVGPIIKLFGIMANLAFFFTLYRVPAMRNITNFYLSNLAVADLLVLLSMGTVEQYQVFTASTKYTSSPYLADVVPVILSIFSFLTEVSTHASLVFVTLITFERYFAICHPLKHRKLSLKKRAIRCSVLSWLLLLSETAISFGSKQVFVQRPKIPVCIVWPNEEKYTDLNGIVHIGTTKQAHYDFAIVILVFNAIGVSIYTICLILNVTLNGLIIKRVRKSMPTDSQIKGKRKEQHRVTLVLGLNTAVVLVCYLPNIVAGVAVMYWSNENFLSPVHVFPLIVAFSFRTINSSINSIIFNAGSSRYREAFKEAFCCSKKQQVRTDNIAMQPLQKQ